MIMPNHKALLGLLYKDLLLMKNTLASYLAILFIFVAIAVVTGNTSMLISFLGVAFMIVCINSISYDEAYCWDRYVLTMPVSRRMVVQSKYLLVLALSVPCLLICILCSFFSGADVFEAILGNLAGFCTIFCMLSLCLPFLLRWGSQKGRIIILVLAAVAAGCIVFGFSMISILSAQGFFSVGGNGSPVIWIAGAAVALLLLLLVGSYLLACKLYEGKQF